MPPIARQKLRDFCRRFAERAFRRPLNDEQKAFFVDRQFKNVPDLETAVKRVGLLVLKSPRFLYRETGRGRPDGYEVASRLSFGLWDSLPDQVLLDAAAAGQLANRDQVARQAERMVADLRTRSKLGGFFLQWLKIDQAPEIVKDPKRFPQFDETVVSDLRTSLDLFLEDVIGSDAADYRQLLRADYVYLNGRLAPALWSQARGGRTIPEGFTGTRRACRPAFSSLLDGELCIHGHELTDPSRGFHCPQHPGPSAPAAARSRCPARPRSSS